MHRPLFFSVFLSFVFFLTACGGGDPCSGVECLHEGTCLNGKCQCPDGFGGDNCGLEIPCHGITCENGQCVGGECQCEVGYEGELCENRSTSKLEGEFAAFDSCQRAGRTEFVLELEEDADRLMFLEAENFHAWQELRGAMDSVEMRLFGDSIFVAEQVLKANGGDITVSGSGVVKEDDGLSVQFRFATKSKGIRDSCFCRWTKQ